MKKQKFTVYVSATLASDIDTLATARNLPKSQIIEAALESFIYQDDSERMEAAVVRRLDRLTRSIERLERDQEIATEAVALFVRFWLTTTPPLPDELKDAAQSKGKERYNGYVETLARRLAKGTTLNKEISRDREFLRDGS